MKKILHVAQDAIRKNRKHGTEEPAIIIRTSQGGMRAREAALVLADGREVGRFVYRPHKPLSCGARLWLEVDTKVCDIVAVMPEALDDDPLCPVPEKPEK